MYQVIFKQRYFLFLVNSDIIVEFLLKPGQIFKSEVAALAAVRWLVGWSPGGPWIELLNIAEAGLNIQTPPPPLNIQRAANF